MCGPSEFQIGILQLHNVAQPLYEFMIDYPAQSGSDNASTRCGRHGELELSREAQFWCVRRGEIVWVQLLEVVGNIFDRFITSSLLLRGKQQVMNDVVQHLSLIHIS